MSDTAFEDRFYRHHSWCSIKHKNGSCDCGLYDAQKKLARLQAIEVERDAWRQALQSLTPGGSEFTKPHECSNFVRDRNKRQWETIKRQKQERDELAAALEKGAR
jgi:hypothetical protein